MSGKGAKLKRMERRRRDRRAGMSVNEYVKHGFPDVWLLDRRRHAEKGTIA